jgi:hypothetical protein
VDADTLTAPAASGGLSERDIIPLVIAVFVDLCILLVSINRPFSRVLRTLSSMEPARNSNLIAFLAPVYRVFSDNFDPHAPPLPGDIIAPLVDAVFDHEGKYYAAAPSNSRYVSSAFDLLQGQNFVRLLRNRKDLNDDAIRKKLKERNSTLAGAHSFRVFEFAPDAWAEFLHAALGSAAAVEMRAAKHRDSLHRTRQQPERLVLNGQQWSHSVPRDEVSQRPHEQAVETNAVTIFPPRSDPNPAVITLPARRCAAPPKPALAYMPTACPHSAAQPPKSPPMLAQTSSHQTQTQPPPPHYEFDVYEDCIDPDYSNEDCCEPKFHPTQNTQKSEKF